MKFLKNLKETTAIVLSLCLFSCSANTKENISFKIEGSTPGDSLIKSMLGIPHNKIAEFIRWDLHLSAAASDTGTFELNINFGEAQPNTNGFKNGGEKILLSGNYSLIKGKGQLTNFTVCNLRADSLKTSISLIKITDDIYHLLTPGDKLMKGNDGWSYTLYKTSKEKITTEERTDVKGEKFPVVLNSSALPSIRPVQTIFQGRTPCKPIAKEQNLPVTSDCFKLKWQITLNRNPETFEPSTFEIKWIFREANFIKGNWQVIHGIPANPEAIIYQLNSEGGSNPFYFLAADENLLFFLGSDFHLQIGNGDFAFTLNRKTEQE